MFQIEHVLIPVHGSQTDGLRQVDSPGILTPVYQSAADLAVISGAQLTFCGIMRPEGDQSESDVSVTQSEETLRRDLISLQEHALGKGIAARCLIRSGMISDELISETFEDPYDLMMFSETSLDAKDHRSAVEMRNRLLSHSRCSAWFMNQPLGRDDTADFGLVSQSSENIALPLAVTLARLLTARLHVMHPINRPEQRQRGHESRTKPTSSDDLCGLRQQTESDLKSQLERTDFRALPFGSKLEIVDDDSVTQIERYAAENQLDLLVVDRERLILNQGSAKSVRVEWSDLASRHSILAVASNSVLV